MEGGDRSVREGSVGQVQGGVDTRTGPPTLADEPVGKPFGTA
jgi:hypothetical protein